MLHNIRGLLDFEDQAYKALRYNWGEFLDVWNLSTFTYLQFFNNDTFTNLCSDQEWSKKYYTMKKIDDHFYKQIMKARNSDDYHVYFWPQDPLKGEITSWLHDHGIGTGFTIFKRSGDQVHGWGFTSGTECTALVNLYLSHKETFLKFGRQFVIEYEKFASEHQCIPYASLGIDLNVKNNLEKYNHRDQLSSMRTDTTLIFTAAGSQTIPQRLWEVMELLSRGYSLKQIAYLLNISVKTVEQRTNSLRSLLKVHSRAQIFDIWKRNASI